MMINLGLVGCGRISRSHFQAVKNLPDVRLVGCCDVDEELARRAAESHDIPYYTTKYLSLLQQPGLDLVSICTPSGLHPKQGIMAANHGKHVLTEKPMAVRTSEAKALIKACQENGVRLFVAFQNRYNPAIQKVKTALDQGRFGRLFLISANVFWHRPQEYYDQASWRGTRAMDGGAFCNQASHYLDLVQWFGGPVTRVKGEAVTLARNIETEDTGSAIIRFRSGCLGSVNVTMLTYKENLEGSLTLLGEKGTVRIGGIAANKILHWQFSDYRPEDSEIPESSTLPPSVYGYGHLPLYQDILKSLNTGTAPLIDGQEGYKSLALIEAIYNDSWAGQ